MSLRLEEVRLICNSQTLRRSNEKDQSYQSRRHTREIENRENVETFTKPDGLHLSEWPASLQSEPPQTS